MPSDGAITFVDLIGQLDQLEIACRKYDRLGRYSVRRLASQYGRDGKIADWVGLMSKDSPRKMSRVLPEGGCGVRRPDLSRLFLPQGWWRRSVSPITRSEPRSDAR